MTTINSETVTWEIHVQMPDGKVGEASFAGQPAPAYIDIERASYWVDRYTSEQVGWKKPVEERKTFLLVEVTTTTTRDIKVPVTIALDGEIYCNDQIRVVRRRIREGVSWYDEDGNVIEQEPVEPGETAAANGDVPHTSTP